MSRGCSLRAVPCSGSLRPGRLLFALLTLCAVLPAHAHESSFSFRGYATTLQGATVGASDTVSAVLSSQQRVNLLWHPADPVRVVVETRGRLFLGEGARPADPLATALARDPGVVDLSWNPVTAEGAVWNVMIDRAYVEYGARDWDFRAGRQRIHWGMDLYWNPGDLFNTRDVLDFDYEESPGADAARFRWFAGGEFWRGAEAAVASDREGRITAAGRALFNAREYDVQVIAGSWRDEPVGAVGFAGNLGRAGWKGEAAWFTGAGVERDPAVNASTSLDYILSGRLEGLYLGGSLFYGSDASGALNAADPAAALPTARRPFPARVATQFTASRPLTPAWSWSAALLWLPEDETVLATPMLNYAAAQAVDLQLLVRAQASWQKGDLQRDLAAAWVRARYSF